MSTISEGELTDFVHLLKSNNPFFDYKTQRDAYKALILHLDIFSNICNLPLKENKISTVPKFGDAFFSEIYKISFICQLWKETNIYYEPFLEFTKFPLFANYGKKKYLLRTFSSYYCTAKYRYIVIFG